MDFNQFLFPSPRSSYSSATYLGELIYIPKYERSQEGKPKQFCAADYPGGFEVPPDPYPNKPSDNDPAAKL